MPKRKVTDAQEPNAGYDFHIVWAIRKCLELLNFKEEGLKAVAVENLDPTDSQEIDADGDILLGVDLTEYFGGFIFTDASQVIISQLKYSTRHPKQEWTVSKMCAGKKGIKGSIIYRLSDAFKGFYDKHSRDQVVKKLVLKLVSNRPVSAPSTEIVRKAKAIAIKSPEGFTLAALNKILTSKEKTELTKLAKAARLKGKTFTDFIVALDFSECNAGSRFSQKQDAYKELTNIAFDAKRQFDSLHALVRSKTVPEAKGNNTILKEDILLEFGFPDIQSMFPAPAKFEPIKTMIDREQMSAIKDTIEQSTGEYPVCIDGEAGIGKSTIARAIRQYLPSESVTILFDCYGGGAYRDPDDKRHLHEKAFLFLCNELALKTGSPFLMERGRDKDYYLTEFKRRIQLASQLFEKEKPSSLFAIIIDAADNSVTAAAHYKTDCFIHDLVNIKFPANARLIVSSRTHRVNSLSLPSGYIPIMIQPFSIPETKIFLSKNFGITEDQEAEEFRTLTNGIPRVMSYALEGQGKTLQEKLNPLKPGGKKLDDIFNHLLVEAEQKSGDTASFNKLLTYLICLPRPVPLQYLISTSGVEAGFVEDFKTDLWKGLIFESNFFRFRDEDFETYLNQKFIASALDYQNIVDVFINDADHNDYASLHLGSFLTHAGKNSLLYTIVLNRSHNKRPLDPVQNREVFIDRTRLAMKHVSATGTRSELLKLQAVAAEASKTNTVLEEIMIKNPELASAFGNVHSNKKMFFQAGNPHWFGRVHLRSAAVLSRNVAGHDQAKEHLKNAESWIRYRNNISDEKRQQFNITEKDLSFGGEAYLRLFGLEAGVNWFSRWRPKEFVFNSIKIFVRHILSTSAEKEIQSWFSKNRKPRFDIKLLINQIFFEEGRKPPFSTDFVNGKLPLLIRIAKKIKYPLLEALISCAEQKAREDRTDKKIIDLLAAIKVEIPQYVPSFYTGGYLADDHLGLMDLYFRKTVLGSQLSKTSLSIDDFLPAKLKVPVDKLEYKEKEAIEKDKRKFTTFYNHLLPVYTQRCKIISKATRSETFKKAVAAILTGFDKDYELSYRYEFDSKYIPRFIGVKLLDTIFFTKDSAELISNIKTGLQSQKGQSIEILLAMADRLSISKKVERSVLELLQNVDSQINALTLAGSKQIEYYTSASIIASRVSVEAGKLYFDKMVNASEEIDLEAHDQIRCVASITKDGSHFNDSRLSFDFSRFVEYCHERLKDWEDFPWDDAVDSITRLHTPSAFAILCRWDHRNVRRVHQHITELLMIGVQNKVLHHRIAGALLPLNIYYWKGLKEVLKAIIQAYDEAGSSIDKNKFLLDVIKDLKLNCDSRNTYKTLSDFKGLIENGKYINSEIVADYIEYCAKLKDILKITEKDVDEPKIPNYDQKRKPIAKGTLKNVDVTSTKALEELLHRKGSFGTLHRDFDLDNIMVEVFRAVKPGQYVAHLDALIAVPPDLLGYWSFEDALDQRLSGWAVYPEVKNWKKQNFRKVLNNRFFHYVRHGDSFQSSSLNKLAQLFEIDHEELSQAVLAILPDYVNDLSAAAIYQLFEISILGTEKSAKHDFLNWLLPRWSTKIKTEFADGEYSESINPGDDMKPVIGKFIRYVLGHPDKRVRWRATHSLTRLGKYGENELIDFLVNEQNVQSCHPFQNGSYPYYWIASKLWLWIGIYKLSSLIPEQVKRYAVTCYQELNNPDLPHAQVLWFIKNTCLELIKQFPDIYTADKIASIHSKLTSSLPKVKEREGLTRKQGERDGLKFPFDTIDTIEHWYDPLGRVFDLSGYDVARIAEKYILEKWGFVGDVSKDDHVYYDDYRLTHHYKSDIPTIENLRTYYEYHGLQCAAGELIATAPLVKGSSWFRSWEEWIGYYVLAWDPQWLSDLIDPIPLQGKFWTGSSDSPDWEWNIQRPDLDEAVGFINPAKPGYLIVNSDITIHYGKDYETQHVASGLTDIKLGPSLLRAMQTGNRFDSHVPVEDVKDSVSDDDSNDDDDNDNYFNDEDDESDQVVAENNVPRIRDKFKLISWIKYMGSKDESVDESDEIIVNFKKYRYFLADDFVSFAGLSISDDKRFSFAADDPKNPVSILETWNNTPEKIEYSSFSSGGQRLFIRIDKLLAFLEARNSALLVKSEIYRKPERRDYSDGIEYYTLFYLIYPNGKVETIGRDFKLR